MMKIIRHSECHWEYTVTQWCHSDWRMRVQLTTYHEHIFSWSSTKNGGVLC